MMGPLLTYDDDPHFEHLLSAACAENIVIRPDPTRGSAFWFRRDWGLIHGSRDCSAPGQFYLGCGHPFNPLLWSADGRLLRELEQLFLAAGSRLLTIDVVD